MPSYCLSLSVEAPTDSKCAVWCPDRSCTPFRHRATGRGTPLSKGQWQIFRAFPLLLSLTKAPSPLPSILSFLFSPPSTAACNNLLFGCGLLAVPRQTPRRTSPRRPPFHHREMWGVGPCSRGVVSMGGTGQGPSTKRGGRLLTEFALVL